MRHLLTPTLAILLITIGCSQKNDEYSTSALDNSAYGRFSTENLDYNPEVMEVASADTGGWSNTTYTDTGTTTGMSTGGGTIHVVKAKETLYGLARLYYNDARQWKKIYEANKNKISDPDKIQIGMELTIP